MIRKNVDNYKILNSKSVEKCKIAVVVSRWNEDITSSLLDGCRKALIKLGVAVNNIFVSYVPGAFELPLGARIALKINSVDAVVCLGCVINGETSHGDYINQAVANGLMQLNLTSGKPIVFGVVTTNDLAQAKARSGGKLGNKGTESAHTAIEMFILSNAELGKKIGFNNC